MKTSASAYDWCARIEDIRSERDTLAQLVAMTNTMVTLTEELRKRVGGDMRSAAVKQLVRELNAKRDSINYSLKYLTQEIT